jgi:cell division inhibitor SepF
MSGMLQKMKSWLFAEDVDEFGPTTDEEMVGVGATPRRRSRLITLPSRSGDIFIRRPRSMEEARTCADCLRDRRAVVVNLKDLEVEQAVRVFDFVAGATYALGGQLEQAGEGVFLATPHNIGIMAEEEPTRGQEPAFWQEI